MVVSERDLSVVFQYNVGLVWIPCLGSEDYLLSLKGPWRPRQPVLRSLGNAGCASVQSFESFGMVRTVAEGHPFQGSFDSQHLPGNKYVSFSYFQIY